MHIYIYTCIFTFITYVHAVSYLQLPQAASQTTATGQRNVDCNKLGSLSSNHHGFTQVGYLGKSTGNTGSAQVPLNSINLFGLKGWSTGAAPALTVYQSNPVICPNLQSSHDHSHHQHQHHHYHFQIIIDHNHVPPPENT